MSKEIVIDDKSLIKPGTVPHEPVEQPDGSFLMCDRFYEGVKKLMAEPEGWIVKWIPLSFALLLLFAVPARADTDNIALPAGNNVVEVVKAATGRYGLTAKLDPNVVATTGANCSQTDPDVDGPNSFALTGSAVTLFGKSSLWCRSQNGAQIIVSYSMVDQRPTSKRIAITATTSTDVLAEDSTRKKAKVINTHASIAVACGYECPMTSATTQNVPLPANNTVTSTLEVLSGASVCCYAATGPAEVTVVIEK